MKRFASPSEYIAAQPPLQRKVLKEMRDIILATVPGATEVISYNMPAVKQKGLITWYASHTNHIGLYPRASVIKAFEKQLEKYECSRGTIRFPLDKKLPAALIRKIIKYRLKEMNPSN